MCACACVYVLQRVKLNPWWKSPSENHDNYINASHVNNLLPGSPEFITAQGPNGQTVPHFWKMVAQQRTRVIVMLTKVGATGRWRVRGTGGVQCRLMHARAVYSFRVSMMMLTHTQIHTHTHARTHARTHAHTAC